MKPSYIFICRSLRKVMLRTCIGADGGGPGSEYPNFAENKVRVAHNGHNGDLAGNHHVRDINHHVHHGGGGGGWSVGEAVTSSELGEVLSELLPEEIPGLPRHRPGEYSPPR